LEATAYLLRVPANAHWLLDSLAQARQGQTVEHDLAR
jgi:PHD/YefM family antitoxin component YafN of YafNO toxin-antitoxin module